MATTYFKSFINKDAYDAYVANADLPSIFVGYCATEDEVYYLKDSPAAQPLTFTAVDECTVHFRDHIYYSTDNGSTWNYNEGEWTYVTLQPNATLQLRGNFNEQFQNGWLEMAENDDTHRYKLSGNIMSLYYPDAYYKATLPSDGSLNFWGAFSDREGLTDVSGLVLPNNCPDSAFREMFTRCPNLVNAGFTINAKNSGIQAFLAMFNDCYNLTTAPTINVKKVCREGMQEMFHNCTSLVNAPDLSSITGVYVPKDNDEGFAAGGAFKRMFNGCTSLTNVPMVPIVYKNTYDTTYESMFEGCSSLVIAPEVTITGANYDGDGGDTYHNMFNGCTSLSDTSKFKFSTEDGYVYFYGSKTSQIFDGCTSLTNIRFTGSSLPQRWPSNWLDNTTGGTITIDAGQSTSDWEAALGLDTSRWTCVEAS